MTQNLAARLAVVGLVLNAAFFVPMYFAAPSNEHFLALFSAWPVLLQSGLAFAPALVVTALSRWPGSAVSPS
jgi:hypothetical protein